MTEIASNTFETTSPYDGHPLVEKARQIAQTLPEHSTAFEQARRVSSEVAKELAAAGFFRMLVPKTLGGGEVHPGVMTRVLEVLATGDSAAAWCVMTGSTTGLLSAYMNEQGATELWTEQPEVIMAGVFAPMGKATQVEGGYQLSGRWPFASGSDNATWRMGGALIIENGRPKMLPDGNPEILSLFFSDKDSELLDTWSVSGLCGTGSHDMTVKEIFVPTHRTASLFTTETKHQGPLYKFPLFGLLAHGINAVSMGIARAAINEFVKLAKKKKGFGGRKGLAEQDLIQMEVAKAEASLRSARAFVYETLESTWKTAQKGDITLQDRALLRMASTHATQASAEAVDRMYHAGGGTSIYTTKSPLQKHFRDVHVATQHIMVTQATMKTIGRALLGQGVKTNQL